MYFRLDIPCAAKARFDGFRSACFSLRGFVLARPKTRKLKHALLAKYSKLRAHVRALVP
jgi:hypothetical protein